MTEMPCTICTHCSGLGLDRRAEQVRARLAESGHLLHAATSVERGCCTFVALGPVSMCDARETTLTERVSATCPWGVILWRRTLPAG